MSVYAQLVERHQGVVDLAIRNRAGVVSYLVNAAVTLDAAYAGTTNMFSVPHGRDFRSPTLQRNRKNLVAETRRGLTRIAYDPVDYASVTVPGDSQISFVRIAEVNFAGTTLPEGPILVVPPPGFFVAGRATIPLTGTAPNIAALPNGTPPANAMRIDLPKYADEITIFNDGGASLFIAFGLGQPEVEVPTATSLTFPEAGVSEVFLRGDGAAVAFRLLAALVNGIQA